MAVGAVLLGMALINAIVDFVQVQNTEAVMKSFIKMVPLKVGRRSGTLINALTRYVLLIRP